MAFEAIVKDQIDKLLPPALHCVDLVSVELGEVIKACGEGVSDEGVGMGEGGEVCNDTVGVH